MATRKIHGGMVHGNGGPGGGGNKPPFNLGQFKPGPQNAMNNNSPKTRRIKKKHSGASAKKGQGAKNYKGKYFKGKNGVVVKLTNFRSKTRANRNQRTLNNINLEWRLGQMGVSKHKEKKVQKSAKFANE